MKAGSRACKVTTITTMGSRGSTCTVAAICPRPLPIDEHATPSKYAAQLGEQMTT